MRKKPLSMIKLYDLLGGYLIDKYNKQKVRDKKFIKELDKERDIIFKYFKYIWKNRK